MKTKLAALFFSLVLFVTILPAQVTLENLMAVPFPTNLVGSVDGKRIGWVFNDRGVRNIYVAEAPEFAARKLTQNEEEDGQEITSLMFTPQGDRLIFAKGGRPNSQNELPNPLAIQNIEQAIWTINWNGELKKLGNGSYPKISPDGKRIAYLSTGQIFTTMADGSGESKKLFQSRGSQNSIRWSPNGNEIAFISGRGDHSFLGVYDLKTSSLNFLDPSVDHDTNPVWSEDGKQIAYIRIPHVRNELPFSPKREGHPWSIRFVDVASGNPKEIWRALPGKGSVLHDGVPDIDNFLFWTNNRIVFPWERDGWIHIYSITSTGGEAIKLTPGDGEVEHMSLSSDKKSIMVVTNIADNDRRHIWKVFSDGSKLQQLSKSNGIEWNEVETTDGIACLRSDATTPAWPHLITAEGQIKMLATELFPKTFPKTVLVIPQAVYITATDGMKIPAQLFLPKNHKDGEKLPAVIFFHGGSRRQMLLGFNYGQYYHNAYSLNQYLASQGYVVLSVNYRSGIGYGLDFREALNYGAAGASEYNDVVGAGLFLQQREDIDPKRIGLWGGSYGGYLTALGLAKASDLFACGVDIHGVHDWNVVIKNFVPSYNAEKNQEFSKKAFESSPMNFMKGWRSPVLLIHGDDDRNVPFSETVALAETLREQNVYFEQLIFPDEVHSFLLYKNWVNAYKATANFFDRHLLKKKK